MLQWSSITIRNSQKQQRYRIIAQNSEMFRKCGVASFWLHNMKHTETTVLQASSITIRNVPKLQCYRLYNNVLSAELKHCNISVQHTETCKYYFKNFTVFRAQHFSYKTVRRWQTVKSVVRRG